MGDEGAKSPGRPRATIGDGDEALAALRYLDRNLNGVEAGQWAKANLIGGIDNKETARDALPIQESGVDEWVRTWLTPKGWERLRATLRQRRRRMGPPQRRPENVTISRETVMRLQRVAQRQGWTLDQAITAALDRLGKG